MINKDSLQSNTSHIESDYISTLLQESIDTNGFPTILCEVDKSDLFHIKIIYCNSEFYSLFNTGSKQIVGNDFSFLFAAIDTNVCSKNQIQYRKLQKAVKIFRATSVIMELNDFVRNGKDNSFRINFDPNLFSNKNYLYCAFSFKELSKKILKKVSKNSTQEALIRSLQKSLHNERLLRKVGNLVISDDPINKIAESIAKILCDHLKISRCILHDYRNGRTGFLAEYYNQSTISMIDKNKGEANFDSLTKYINFQKKLFDNSEKVKTGSAVSIYKNVNNNFRPVEIEEICTQYDIVSQISMVTIFNKKINGGIYLHQSSPRDWMEEEVALIETIAEQFSVAIDRSYSIKKVVLANSKLLGKTLELREALKEEKRVRKMQNEFVAMVSHEFKTPLQIIDSTRELILMKMKKFSIEELAVEKYLNKIKSAISRMNSLIQSTLNLSKIEMTDEGIQIKRHDFSIKNLINEIVEKNHTLTLDKNIHIISDIDNLPEFYYGDARLLEHCFTNVITNAVKYSKDHTSVKIVGSYDDKNICVKVTDTGIGIPKEDISSVGRKFFRAKNTLAVAGTGIGLYLTKNFIDSHGGSLTIESELGLGTTASISLPIVPKEEVVKELS